MAADMDSIAGALKRIESRLQEAGDARLDSFKGLLSSIESSLADLIEGFESGSSAEGMQAVAGALEKLALPAPAVTVNVPEQGPVQLSDQSVKRLAEAFGRVQLQFTAEVPAGPAPMTVLNAPRVKHWKIRVPGVYGAPDREMTLTPTYED